MLNSMKYYTIKDITLETGLSVDTLRYYEKDGILADIKRHSNGHRIYSSHDLEWIRFIMCLRSTGMPLKKIKQYKSLMNKGENTASERKALLVEQRERIMKEIEILKEALPRIDYKIEYYKSIEEGLEL